MAQPDSVIAKEWTKVEEDVDKNFIRPIMRENLKCILNCIDLAGNAWSNAEMENCKRPCMQKVEVQTMVLQRELNESRKRFEMAITECQYKVRDMAPSSSQEFSNKQINAFYNCETKAVQELLKTIQPMKERLRQDLQRIEKK